MWRAFRIGLVGAIASLLGSASAGAEPATLTGEVIKSTVAGAIVELDTPLGTKIPVKFSSDGLMAGEAGTLSGFLGAARDRGRWWVDSNRLCMKWFRWFDAEAHCMSLRQQGEQIFWQEQSGRSGTAKIAGRLDEKPAMPSYATASVVPSLVGPPSVLRQAERQAGQPAGPSVIESLQAEQRESRRVKDADARAPQSRLTSAQPLAKQGVTAAMTPEAPSQPDRPPAHAGSRVVRNAAPPLPVRSVARRPAPPDSSVRVPSFSVIRVAHDDVLNVRVGPSENHQRVGALPPDGRGIRIIGGCRGLWCPIRHGRVSGWVNTYFLAAELPSSSALAGAR